MDEKYRLAFELLALEYQCNGRSAEHILTGYLSNDECISVNAIARALGLIPRLGTHP